jgi:hypothetical protein
MAAICYSAIGDWIVLRILDGAIFALGDEAFKAGYQLIPSA